ncbi:hypothetical protein [Prevotella sp.]|nr:hypothetical protein [Prevotella sp.]MDN5552570.1 hypothetical protein [Prevotella sp.]
MRALIPMKFFNNSFGIVKDNTPMERIVFRAYQKSACPTDTPKSETGT